MATMREYAASLGLAQLGKRGRLSNDARKAIEDARAKGMTFDDDPAPTIVSDEKTEAKEPVPVKANVNDFGPTRPDWTSEKYIKFEEPAGMTWHKVACIECGYSVSNCRCGNTQVWGDHGRVACKLVR